MKAFHCFNLKKICELTHSNFTLSKLNGLWQALLSQTPRGEPHYRLHTAKGISVNLQEQDKSSDIEQQPPFGDRKISNIQTQNRGGVVVTKTTGTSYNFDKV